ncbi:MAG: DUF4249 domain-containing protein [Bacteroidetes bacterium]|nr:DUF4249 domain-containing protein [Bacteroidota bacterium]
MKNAIWYLFLAVTLIILGCTNDSPTESTNQNTLVVEAFLYAEEPINSIKLTKSIGLGSNDTIAPTVDDASISLIKNGKSYQLINDQSRSGYYIYDGTDISVNPGDNFSLLINYQGKQVTGSTTVPSKPENVQLSKATLTLVTLSGFPGPGGGGGAEDTNSIYLKWSNPDSSLYYVVIENLETNPTEISTGNLPPGAQIIRRMTFPPISASEFVIGRRNLTYYGNHKAIVYKVNQEYADLYESRNQDSRNLNEPLTNIKNGLGVFSAFASEVVYFNVK